MLIGQVSRRAGITPATIRYYEDIGLLTAPPRSVTGYRHYRDGAVDELLFIRKAQALGFSLDEIKEILNLSRAGARPCEYVLERARLRLDAIGQRIQQLQVFQAQLSREIARWDRQPTQECQGLCQMIMSSEVGTPKDDS